MSLNVDQMNALAQFVNAALVNCVNLILYKQYSQIQK